MEELDEFEIFEEFADNMSFCSNSSIVTKPLKGLQSDRILAGRLPTVGGFYTHAHPLTSLSSSLMVCLPMRHEFFGVQIFLFNF